MHYVFYGVSNTSQNIGVQYNLPLSEVVTVRVLDPFSRVVETLVDAEEQAPGLHVAIFDSSVTNGIYTFFLPIEDSVSMRPFYVRDDDIDDLELRPPLISSDLNGKFFLTYSTLGIGRTFQPKQGKKETIQDSITVVLITSGYRTLVESFKLDTTMVIAKTFTMAPE